MVLTQKLLQGPLFLAFPTRRHRLSTFSAVSILFKNTLSPYSSVKGDSTGVRFQHSAGSQADPKSFQRAGPDQTRPSGALEVTQSWTAEHRTETGALHRFVTVIIDEGQAPGAAALAWHHARKLLGGPPNVGVAYVSNPTAVAARAVAELASRMGAANEGKPSGKPSQKAIVAEANDAIAAGKGKYSSNEPSNTRASETRLQGKKVVFRTEEVPKLDARGSGGPILFDSRTWREQARRGSERKGFGRAERSQKAVIYQANESRQERLPGTKTSAAPERAEGERELTSGVLPLVGCTASSWAYKGEEGGGEEKRSEAEGSRLANEDNTQTCQQGNGEPSSSAWGYIRLPPLGMGTASEVTEGGREGKGSPWVRLIYPGQHQEVLLQHWENMGFEPLLSSADEFEQTGGFAVSENVEAVSAVDDSSDEDEDFLDEPREIEVRVVYSSESDSDSDPESDDGDILCDDEQCGMEYEYPPFRLPLPYDEGRGYVGLMDGREVMLDRGANLSNQLGFFTVLQRYLDWRHVRVIRPRPPKTPEASRSEQEYEGDAAMQYLKTEVEWLDSLQLEAYENQDTEERRVFFRFAYTNDEGVQADGIFFLSDELIPPDKIYEYVFAPRTEPLDPSDTLIRHVLDSSSPAVKIVRKEVSGNPPSGYKFVRRLYEEGKCRDGGGGEGTQAGDGEALEERFRLTFVAGVMPGVKVEAFHSKKASLPNLQNLEEMILRSQPHFLLFGQPGFDHSAFRDRLTCIFPDSAKAGVFSTPTSVLSAAGGSIMNDGPLKSQLYFGDQTAAKGVCGLALYSEDGGVIPVDAFSAFVKEAIGAPRFSGTFVFDDSVSRDLFRPNKKEASRAERRRALRSSDEKLESLESLFKSWSARLEGPVNSHVAPSKNSRTSTSGLNRASAESALWKGPKDPDAILDGLQLANKYIEQRQASLERRFGPLNAEQGAGDGPERVPLKQDPRLAPGKIAKLPLFLVHPPPCPGETIERFIFEPRYRLLAKHCVEEGSPLGVCTLEPDPATGQIVGTAASIEVVEYDEAFRSNVELHGIRRFRLTTPKIWVPPSSFGLYVAEVEFFDDAPCGSEQERRELVELAQRSVALFERSYPNEWRRDKVLTTDVSDPVAVSFALAEALPTRPYTKQRWLAGTCTRQRLQEQMHNMKVRSTQTSSITECFDKDG